MYITKHRTSLKVTDMPPTVVYLFLRHPNKIHCVLLRLTFESVCLQKSSIVVIAIFVEFISFSASVISSAC